MAARKRQMNNNEKLKQRILGATMPETRGLLQYPKEVLNGSVNDLDMFGRLNSLGSN